MSFCQKDFLGAVIPVLKEEFIKHCRPKTENSIFQTIFKVPAMPDMSIVHHHDTDWRDFAWPAREPAALFWREVSYLLSNIATAANYSAQQYSNTKCANFLLVSEKGDNMEYIASVSLRVDFIRRSRISHLIRIIPSKTVLQYDIFCSLKVAHLRRFNIHCRSAHFRLRYMI